MVIAASTGVKKGPLAIKQRIIEVLKDHGSDIPGFATDQLLASHKDELYKVIEGKAEAKELFAAVRKLCRKHDVAYTKAYRDSAARMSEGGKKHDVLGPLELSLLPEHWSVPVLDKPTQGGSG
eukprot:3397385-Alexandrium_andersonii.AAC.1